ncbi:hypothetical protein V2O64_13325 [Verrucomicrobiaceae bacterium 227]
MKRFLITKILSVVLSGVALAGSSQTQLIVQLILGHGDAESWDGDHYRIADVPFLKWQYQGHPAYEAIAQTNAIFTDASRRERLPDNIMTRAEVFSITIGSGRSLFPERLTPR